MNASRVRRIVVTGGPGTGKTTLIRRLEQRGHAVFHEISRELTKDAQKQGVSQPFLKDPVEFSRTLLMNRLNQYREAERLDQARVFYDRGLPDVIAYLDYRRQEYPAEFEHTCKNSRYDRVFLLPPWKGIYIRDNERYETFDIAKRIHQSLLSSYRRFGYQVEQIPPAAVDERLDHLLNALEKP